MKNLLYSFEKFKKLQTNPAAEVAEIVHRNLKDSKLEILPVSSELLWEKLRESIRVYEPDLIVGFGVTDTPTVCLEYFALNILDFPSPDESGKIVRHTPIDKESPSGLNCDFDLATMRDYLKEREIPVKISYNSGTYICNLAYFHCLNHIRKNASGSKAIFIHTPLSPKEVNTLQIEKPSFPPDRIAQAISEYLATYTKES